VAGVFAQLPAGIYHALGADRFPALIAIDGDSR
jgi:hypothetical protein